MKPTEYRIYWRQMIDGYEYGCSQTVEGLGAAWSACQYKSERFGHSYVLDPHGNVVAIYEAGVRKP